MWPRCIGEKKEYNQQNLLTNKVNVVVFVSCYHLRGRKILRSNAVLSAIDMTLPQRTYDNLLCKWSENTYWSPELSSNTLSFNRENP